MCTWLHWNPLVAHSAQVFFVWGTHDPAGTWWSEAFSWLYDEQIGETSFTDSGATQFILQRCCCHAVPFLGLCYSAFHAYANRLGKKPWYWKHSWEPNLAINYIVFHCQPPDPGVSPHLQVPFGKSTKPMIPAMRHGPEERLTNSILLRCSYWFWSTGIEIYIRRISGSQLFFVRVHPKTLRCPSNDTLFLTNAKNESYRLGRGKLVWVLQQVAQLRFLDMAEDRMKKATFTSIPQCRTEIYI